MLKFNPISFSEASNIKNLVSLICSDDILNYQRLFFNSVSSTFVQNFLPLPLRLQPETYTARLDNELNGVISLIAQKGNIKKWNIIRLFLKRNSFDVGKQLLDHVISHFGALGVTTFSVEVDDFQEELIELFVKGSKFRMCSCIGLHKVTNINFVNDEELSDCILREFNISDAKKVSELFNDNIFPIFKTSLSKNANEFFDIISSYFVKNSFKFVAETKQGLIISYLEITTTDNQDYMVDIVLSQGFYARYPQILTYAVRQILKRKHSRNIYIKNRKYLLLGHEIEKFFRENHFEMLQNKVVLVKDFYRTSAREVKLSAFNFGEMFNNPALNSTLNNHDKLN